MQEKTVSDVTSVLDIDKSQFEISKTFTLTAVKYAFDLESGVNCQLSMKFIAVALFPSFSSITFFGCFSSKLIYHLSYAHPHFGFTFPQKPSEIQQGSLYSAWWHGGSIKLTINLKAHLHPTWSELIYKSPFGSLVNTQILMINARSKCTVLLLHFVFCKAPSAMTTFTK